MSAGLSISLFGTMRVALDGVPLPPVRSRKAHSLLALLVLRNGRPAARGWLATTLWPDAELTTALSSLRPVVSELRKALGPEGRRLRAGDRHAVAFDVDGLSIDALAFDRAIEARAFAVAVETYAGPLLEGWEEEWTFQERRVRQEAFVAALLRLGETAIERKAPDEAVALFRRAVVAEPFRDAPRRGAMRAYAAAGDLNAALQEYREYAHRLGGEFGTAPEEQTTVLYDRLRQEVRKTPKAPTVREGAPPLPIGHVPTPLTALIGRDDERLDIAGLLRRSRLVSLTGFGGIGKTRLALAVAADHASRFPDGVWFVRLEELADGALLARHVGDVLGLREIPNESWSDVLKERLRGAKALLVLDNCEHLQAACAELVVRLLSACPGLQVLTTGRQALGIVGETAWVVPALAVPGPGQLPEGRATGQRVAMGYEGVRLFVERAEAVGTGFALTAENVRTVAEICFRLEGIPLALELTAARVNALTVEQILERLRARLDLASVNRVASARQRTLRSTLEWSHELLSEPERVLFRRLSVFGGGWTTEAALDVAAVDGDRAHVADRTSSLVDRSLVGFDAQAGRYRWSEIVRQFAEEKLREAGEAEAVRRRRLDWGVALAERAEPMLKGPEQRQWLRRIEVEMPNLRMAVDGAAQDGAAQDGVAQDERACEAELRLTGALSRFWYTRGEFKEGRARLSAALGRPGAKGRTAARAKALYGQGVLAYCQCDYDEAQASHEESLAIRRELGDRRGVAESLLNLGNVAHSRGDYPVAEAYYDLALEIHTEIDDPHGASQALSNLAAVKLAQGQNRAARGRLEQSLETRRKIGNAGGVAWDLNALGILAAERGDYLEAQGHFNECLAVFEELGNRSGSAWTLLKLASIEGEEERFDSARALLERSRAIFDELGDAHGQACAIVEASLVARGSGDLAAARSDIDRATELFRKIEDRQAVAYATQRRGVLDRLEGDLRAALACHDDALATFLATGERRGVMRVLRERATIAAGQGRHETAVVIWGAAEAIREAHELSIPPSEMRLFVPSLAAARAALGDLAFGAAFEKGRALKPKEAVDVVVDL